MTTSYEWTVELLEDATDPDGDILDTSAFDTLADALHFMTGEDNCRLVLVRNVGNDIEGLTARLWAYVEDGELPDYFEDGGAETAVRVPAKFHAELARA